ncbi:hypothetical protein, partial [Acetobacter orleanensis]|uniref:hypothetical protein n=1 Tax=Acetobacter orleanensis TaxID=104099 RepID=UPI00114475DA
MSARMSKVQTKAAKVAKAELVNDPKISHRPRASKKKPVDFVPESNIGALETSTIQRDTGLVAASSQNEINGAQPIMQDSQEFQTVIYFDGGWYLAMYPDVREAGIDPLEHFLNHGSQEGRSPNALFDSQAYL